MNRWNIWFRLLLLYLLVAFPVEVTCQRALGTVNNPQPNIIFILAMIFAGTNWAVPATRSSRRPTLTGSLEKERSSAMRS